MTDHTAESINKGFLISVIIGSLGVVCFILMTSYAVYAGSIILGFIAGQLSARFIAYPALFVYQEQSWRD